MFDNLSKTIKVISEHVVSPERQEVLQPLIDLLQSKVSQGKADPKIANSLLRQMLES